MKREKELNKVLKIIAKSSIIVLIGVGISKILTYIYRIIIARYFGPEEYGLFSLALMVSGILIALSSLGLPEGILRYVSIYRGKNKLRELKYSIRFSVKFVALSSILVGILLYILAETLSTHVFHNKELAIFLKIFSIAIPITAISNIFLSVLRSFEKIKEFSFITNIIRNLPKAIFLLVLIFIGVGAISIPISHVLGVFLMLYFSYVNYKSQLTKINKTPPLQSREKKIISREIYSYSWPILFVSALQITLSWIDSFFLGYFKGVFEVGLYAAALPIAMLLYFVPELFMQIFFPIITKAYAKGNIKLIEEISKQVSKWIFMINIPIFVLIFSFPNEIINILFGSQYLEASQALRFLSIGFLITTAAPTICYHLLLMAGRSKVIFYNTLGGIILNTILNIIFIPMKKIWFINNELGINGAALATTVSIIIMNAIIIIETKKYLSITPIRRKTLIILLAAAIPAIALIFFKNNQYITFQEILIISIFFILLYILLLLLFKALDKNDKTIISTIKTKLYRRKMH